MDQEVSYRRTLENALRTAVAKGATDVAYQPLMGTPAAAAYLA